MITKMIGKITDTMTDKISNEKNDNNANNNNNNRSKY